MDIYLEAYRNRIGIFSSSRHINFKPRKLRRKDYKSSTKDLVRFRTFRTLLLLTFFLLHMVYILHRENRNYQTTGSTVSVSKPVSSSVLGGQVSDCLHVVYILGRENPNYQPTWSFTSVSNPIYSIILGGTLSDSLSLDLRKSDVGAAHSAAPVGFNLDRGFIMITSTTQFSGFSDSNLYARCTYGNRNNKGIKLCHWNAGSAHLENKTSEIEKLVADYNPHILGISEANLYKKHSIDNCKIADYDLITSNTINNKALQISRVVVYKHTSLVAKIRDDLMSDRFSSIWLEVGFPGKAKILVCNIYRDWQYLGQSDHSSHGISEQLARWILFLEQWEEALDTGKECIVMGDFNLDFLKFNSSELQSNGQGYRLKPLEEELFSRVVPHGVKQCVVGPTRQGAVGQADSGLDHFWTNTPGKMSQIYTKFNGSDHKAIFGVRYCKMIRSSTRYVKKRSYKSFDESKFIESIRGLNWWDLYESEDVNEAVNILTTSLPPSWTTWHL